MLLEHYHFGTNKSMNKGEKENMFNQHTLKKIVHSKKHFIKKKERDTTKKNIYFNITINLNTEENATLPISSIRNATNPFNLFSSTEKTIVTVFFTGGIIFYS